MFKISLEKIQPTWKRAHYRAVIQWLQKYIPQDTSYYEQVKGYIEASYHLREVGDWEKASILLQTRLNTGEELHVQLGIWGYYNDQENLYKSLIGKDSSILDILCFNGLGRSYLERGYYDQAIEYYKNALSLKSKDNLSIPIIEGMILWGLGKACLFMGKSAEAVHYHESQIKIASNNNDDNGKSYAFIGIGDVYSLSGDFGKATEKYLQAMNLSYRTLNQRCLRRAFSGLGRINYHMGLYEIAIQYHNLELEFARDISDSSGEINALIDLGDDYFSLKHYNQAIISYKKALQMSLSVGNKEGESITLCNLGKIYYIQVDYTKSVIHYQQSLEISHQTGARLLEAEILFNWSLVERSSNRYLQALEKLQEARLIFDEIDSLIGKAKVLKEIAEIHLSIKNFSLAKDFCEQSLSIANNLKLQSLSEDCQRLQTLLAQKEAVGDSGIIAEVLKSQLDKQHYHIKSLLEITKIQAQSMSNQSGRSIYTGGGNYIESNSGVYVEGDYINMSQDLSEAASQIQQLLVQLQNRGVSQNDSQQQVASDLATQAKTNDTIRGKLTKWGQSLGDVAAKTTVSEAIKTVITLALGMI
jgi:tetratricopeptide (TPR) repeat protein